MASEEFSCLLETMVANIMTATMLEINGAFIYGEAHRTISAKTQAALKKIYQHVGEDFNQEKRDNLVNVFEPTNFVLRMLEMLVCKNVDAVDYYEAQMLRKSFKQRPELMRASEYSVQMSTVLQSSNIDEIILKVVERKVQELSYKGLAEIINYLNATFKLKFDSKSPDYQEALEVFYARNIFVHNGGIVNEIYLQNTRRADLKVGDRYPLTTSYFLNGTGSLAAFIYNLDKQYLSHFKLA
jgi:hypothetical protein